MRSTIIPMCCLLVVAGAAFAQSDRGTITGSITDPAGAVIPGAAIEVKNINTDAVYQVQSSSTGNYTFSQLPAGKYLLIDSRPLTGLNVLRITVLLKTIDFVRGLFILQLSRALQEEISMIGLCMQVWIASSEGNGHHGIFYRAAQFRSCNQTD